MLNTLKNYVYNIEDPQANFDLALEYDALGQSYTAISYYLRTANFTDNRELAYTCLLKMGTWFIKHECRNFSAETTLQQAVAWMPKRPEAYQILATFWEKNKKYLEAYQLATTAIEVCDFNLPPLPVNFGKIDLEGLMIQKFLSGWHMGKEDQTRDICQELVNNHWDKLDQSQKELVEMHITSLGCGWGFNHKYVKEMHEGLNFKFPGSETINDNFAQVYQDLFVLFMTNGKRNGSFLEVGGSLPWQGNNSAMLERDFDWRGVSIEIKQDQAEEYKKARPNIDMMCTDALQLDYTEVCKKFPGNTIDYLQIDIEPARKTFEVLLKIPFNQYKFSVITYEHDYYCDVTRSFRDKSRKYLTALGYELVVSDVCPRDNCPFEDWWVHPDLVPRDKINQIKNLSSNLKSIDNFYITKISKKKAILDKLKNKSNVTTNFSAINNNYQKGIWVIDNFYKDPDAVREFALKQEYIQGGLGRGFIGSRTAQQFLFPELKEEFERIMGHKITVWEDHGMNGRFQYGMEGDPNVYHCDTQTWAGMLYLTPDAPYQTGTGTFAGKNSDIRHSSHPEILNCFRPGSQNLDGTIFEPVDVIGNVYNRLFIFNAGYLHSALGYFGYNKENSRLWQMFFFD
jgi:tetratricopeptide (TPR) repeat protein